MSCGSSVVKMLRLLWLFLVTYSTAKKSIIDKNDTALEYLNNCKCVSDIYCYNGVMNVRGVDIMTLRNNVETEKESVRIPCSKPSFVCCRERPEDKMALRSEQKLPNTSSNQTKKEVTNHNEAPESEKLNGNCGKQMPVLNIRIFSDPSDINAAIDGEFPWMTSIYRKTLEGTFKFRCAGSLLSDSVVLTAGHCVYSGRHKPEEFKVLANGKILLQDIGVDVEQEREIAKVIVHPQYYAGGGHNDIALLILKNSYKESHQLNSVCLPDGVMEYNRNKCLVTGWGAEQKGTNSEEKLLRKVEVPILNHAQCENLLKSTKLGSNFVLHESFICAGGQTGKDSCKGDGGGPLVCPTEEGAYIQVGIVSWGVGCAIKNHPGVYTNVEKFKTWIGMNIE